MTRQFGRKSKERDIAEARVQLASAPEAGAATNKVNRSVIAGQGLSGGGVLFNDVTLDVNPGTGLGFSGDQLVLSFSGNPTTITPDAGTSAGVSLYAARIDHTHAIAAAAPITINTSHTTPAEGVSTSFARADHQHGIATAAPTTPLSVLSTNAVGSASSFSRSDHSHAITASSDVGSPGFIEASILKSTPAGGLTLKTLTVKGAVDIAGGDLTVGSNVFHVSVSGNNAGIAGPADPQFALRVYGPLRADAIYGPLGRLLKKCFFLAHYDGPPNAYDYSGSPQTVQGLIPTGIAGGVVYRPGVFGKGYQAAEATTNKATNPVFGNSTWNALWNTGADMTAVQTTNALYVYSGYSSVRLTRSGAGTGNTFYQNLIAGNTNVHTLSAYFKKLDGSAVTDADIDFYIYTVSQSPDGIVEVGDGWYMAWKTIAAVAAGSGSYGVVVHNVGASIILGGMQLEEKPYPTPLCHGDMAPGHSWAGTAHGSSSSRTASQMIYTGVAMPTTEWSLGLYYQPWILPGEHSSIPWVLTWGYNADNYLRIANSSSLAVHWVANGVSTVVGFTTAVTRGAKHHIAVTKSASEIKFYLDGALIGTLAAPGGMAGTPTLLGVGNHFTGTNPANGMIDDLYIVSTVQTQDDIRAIIDSAVPVAAEHGVTSWYSGGIAQVWVDGSGFYMRDSVTGTPVFGWSAVNGKSWGGVTLDAGDGLLGAYGASDGGWWRFDRDGVSSKPYVSLGYSDKTVMEFDTAGARLNGYLNLSTTGGIFQGTGTFASPQSALKIYNNAGVGNIEMWGQVENTGTPEYGKVLWLTDRALNLRTTRSIGEGAIHWWDPQYSPAHENVRIWATDIGYSTLNIFTYPTGPTNLYPGEINLQAGSGYASGAVTLHLEGKGTDPGQTDGYAAVNLGLSTQKFVVNRGGAEKFSVDGDGLLTCVQLTTNAGTHKWDLAGFVASADAASNGYVTVTINGTAYKLMTRA
jgi:hypothetical protein